jgi:hypothetical protein
MEVRARHRDRVKSCSTSSGLPLPKSYGATGLHILVPMKPELRFPAVRGFGFAKAVAKEVVGRVGDEDVATRPERRPIGATSSSTTGRTRATGRSHGHIRSDQPPKRAPQLRSGTGLPVNPANERGSPSSRKGRGWCDFGLHARTSADPPRLLTLGRRTHHKLTTRPS